MVGGLDERQIQPDGEQEVKALIVSPLQFPSDQLLGVSSCSRNKPVSSSPCAMKLEHDTVSVGVTIATSCRSGPWDTTCYLLTCCTTMLEGAGLVTRLFIAVSCWGGGMRGIVLLSLI